MYFSLNVCAQLWRCEWCTTQSSIYKFHQMKIKMSHCLMSCVFLLVGDMWLAATSTTCAHAALANIWWLNCVCSCCWRRCLTSVWERGCGKHPFPTGIYTALMKLCDRWAELIWASGRIISLINLFTTALIIISSATAMDRLLCKEPVHDWGKDKDSARVNRAFITITHITHS